MSFKRRLQRNAARSAKNRAAIKGEGPKPGDIIVGCIHKPDPRMGAHCFYVGTDTGKPALKLSSKNVHGEELAKWIFLCHECNDAHGADITKALAEQKVPLKYVHIWTEEDGTLTILPVTFEKKNDEGSEQGNGDGK